MIRRIETEYQFGIGKVNGRFKEETKETEISAEEACRLLYNSDNSWAAVPKLTFDTADDIGSLTDTYLRLYGDLFNIRQEPEREPIDHQERERWTSDMDNFRYENLIYRFSAGIRELDPRYARVNSHATIFEFGFTRIYKVTFPFFDDTEGKILSRFGEREAYKVEEENHLSYKDAKEYLGFVWSEYERFFQDAMPKIDLELVSKVNQQFARPWYEKLREYD